jgi:hypothetical protein
MMNKAPTGPLLVLTACCLGGCAGGGINKQYEMVPELVAAEDISAGTIIKEGQFRTGKLYYKKGERPGTGPKFEEAPDDLFPGNMIAILAGKKVTRALKKGEVAKIGDIAESDGSPFVQPSGAR